MHSLIPDEIINQFITKMKHALVCQKWCYLWRIRVNYLTISESFFNIPNSICVRNIKSIYLCSEANHHVSTLLKFQNLTSLEIPLNNSITDESLKLLTDLTNLDIYYAKNITYDSLKYLTNLKSLKGGFSGNADNVSESYINSIYLFLDKLHSLNICYSDHITDGIIRRLTNLKSLNLSYRSNTITRNLLKCLTNLQTLNLEYQTVSRDALVDLTNLTCLNIRGCEHIKSYFVDSLTKLKSLYLNNAIDDSSLKMKINLEYLCLPSYCSITDNSLMYLTNLKTLIIQKNNKITYRSLYCLSSLTSLTLGKCNYNIIERGLNLLTNLIYLRIDRMSIDCNTLSHLTNLIYLRIERTAIDCDTLSHLTNLIYLRIDRFSTNCDTLTHLKNLECLTLDKKYYDGLVHNYDDLSKNGVRVVHKIYPH